MHRCAPSCGDPQLELLRALGWPKGPPTALELEKLMVDYSTEQSRICYANEDPDERRWRNRHGRGRTAAEDAALQWELDGLGLSGRGLIKDEDDVSSGEDQGADGASASDEDDPFCARPAGAVA